MRQSLAVGLTYVGAVVGAGFASGQEIYIFFSRHGAIGGLGVIVAGTGFFLIGWLALERGRISPGMRYHHPGVNRFVDVLTIAFLGAGLTVVVSGGGATLGLLFGWPAWLGALGTLIAILTISWMGVDWVVRANVLLIPYLIALTIWVSFWYVPRGTQLPSVTSFPGHWALSALLYVSYNLFTAVLVLVGLGRTMNSRASTGAAALLGAAVLSIMALLEHRVLLSLQVVGSLPLVMAAQHIHPILGLLYGISLWIALFTTGIAEAYALVQRLGRHRMWSLIVVYPLSGLGFQTLVATMYPIMGLFAVLIWAPLLQPRRHAKR
ncbi:MAG: transporter [Sulfobacillus benefaciens]|uniref:Transporter n=1 Tax=Sulfobacillus benefaciens TaxID=453960 RepID=A0A2T2XHN8_9FIRM|nr:MAG: transporter [Sulfobacillus benefaciens]